MDSGLFFILFGAVLIGIGLGRIFYKRTLIRKPGTFKGKKQYYTFGQLWLKQFKKKSNSDSSK
jgi:hypothetical protein